MKKRYERHAKILDLIAKHPIGTQDELMQRLEGEGIKATQATISRDIRDLKIAKEKDASGMMRYRVFDEKDDTKTAAKLARLIASGVKSVVVVQFMCVVKTEPQTANVIAALIDEQDDDEIVATMAGYDTLILITQDEQRAENVKQKLLAHIPFED